MRNHSHSGLYNTSRTNLASLAASAFSKGNTQLGYYQRISELLLGIKGCPEIKKSGLTGISVSSHSVNSREPYIAVRHRCHVERHSFDTQVR
jgi:hypothetical protein